MNKNKLNSTLIKERLRKLTKTKSHNFIFKGQAGRSFMRLEIDKINFVESEGHKGMIKIFQSDRI